MRARGAVGRLPLAAFGGLALATIAAFFITQHLKVTTPLIAGAFGPIPPVIHPGDGGCPGQATVSFHLLHQADEINVYVVGGRGQMVRTLATGVPAGRKQPLQFTWDGRQADGAPAPRGQYDFKVTLIHQHRTIDPLINQTYEQPATVTVKQSCSRA